MITATHTHTHTHTHVYNKQIVPMHMVTSTNNPLYQSNIKRKRNKNKKKWYND